MFMIVPCTVQKINEKGLWQEDLYQHLIIEEGIEYSLIKGPDYTLEVWYGEKRYTFENKDYVFSNLIYGEYLIVPFEKVLYQ